MVVDLSRVGERGRLLAKREPYWQRLYAGCFVGYRPSKRGVGGTWIARAYDDAGRSYQLRSQGDYGHLPANEAFAVAKKDAEAFAEAVATGGGVSRRDMITVADACAAYSRSRPEAEQRFARTVYNDPIAKLKLGKL